MFLSGLTLDNIYPEENNLIAYRHKIDNSLLASRKYGLEGYYINMHKFNILLNSIIEEPLKVFHRQKASTNLIEYFKDSSPPSLTAVRGIVHLNKIH